MAANVACQEAEVQEQEHKPSPPRSSPEDISGLNAPLPTPTRLETALSDADIPWTRTPVLRALRGVADTLNHSEYSPTLLVNEEEGDYRWDCSSMAQWILARATPEAEKWMASGLPHRPLAANFALRLGKLSPQGREQHGWKRIVRIVDLEPGDLIAWLKPKEVESKNTGHVAFVARKPILLEGTSDAFFIRVIDSTSLYHHNDSRFPGNSTGFGTGTILLVAETDGSPRAFGWVGTRSRLFETKIAMGRARR